eukprot:GDKH01028586.1.p1 GENE.GDKH01028586.1~~GDKH01028586.1.p1  ORF type:complete len:213 (+),score=75.20 GDKH01028586.1:34-672(+)
MVKHNNILPNVHLRKWWQRYVKTWFNQPGRKESRRLKRVQKAKDVAPRPVAGLLRPAVHPPTQRYNLKIREGRGFTLGEIKEAGLSKKTARTVGIAVDHRRRNKCVESRQLNVNRLKEYQSKLAVFPKNSGAKAVKKGDTPKSEMKNFTQNTCKTILPLPKPELRIKSRKIDAEDKKVAVYALLRKQRMDAKNMGKYLKKKADDEAAAKAKL